MRTQSVDPFRAALLAALGLAPLAGCGGATEGSGGNAGTVGNGSGGRNAGFGGHGLGGVDTSSGGDAPNPSAGGTSPLGAGGSTILTTGGASTNGRGGNTIFATGGNSSTGGSKIVATGGNTTGGSTKFPCRDEQDLDATGSFKICEGGWTHRTHATECQNRILPGQGPGPSASPSEDRCLTNADCGLYATCSRLLPSSAPGNSCVEGCVTDADCGDTAICECGDLIGRCVQAECKSDADCGDGLLCASYKYLPGCDFLQYACQKPSDTCAADSDCTGACMASLECGGYERCTLGAQGRVCAAPGCAIGRPFLIDGIARVAEVIVSEGWSGVTSRSQSELAEPLRGRVIQAWLEAAQMEHASIAAFARFSLELLAFGAPAELVRLASQAMLDETCHARDAFAIASDYAGQALGPASLDIGPVATPDLASSLMTTFLEGCIGETIAALQAAESLRLATVPAVREALARVAVEEARHAELAWRFVQWALPKAPHTLRAALEHALERELDAAPSASQGCRAREAELEAWTPALQEHGVLSKETTRAIRQSALRHIVAPCLASLLASLSGSGATSSLEPCPEDRTPANAEASLEA